MRFFSDLLGVQGITINRGAVGPYSPRTGLRVYASNKGQGNVTPVANQFGDHAINQYGNKFYDPSYGTGSYDTLWEWEEDDCIQSYFVTPNWQDNDPNQQEVYYVLE